MTSITEQDCSTTTFRYEVRAVPPPPEPSNASGRRRAAARRRAAEENTSLCPASLTACKIDGSVDGYEVGPFSLLSCLLEAADRPDCGQCIDTLTELESCGGCRHGVFTAATSDDRVRIQRQQGVSLSTAAVAAEVAAFGVECVLLRPGRRSSSPRADPRPSLDQLLRPQALQPRLDVPQGLLRGDVTRLVSFTLLLLLPSLSSFSWDSVMICLTCCQPLLS